MEITRRKFIQASAATGGVAAAGVLSLGGIAWASARKWFLPHASWLNLTSSSLGGSETVVNNAFNQGTTWFMIGYQGPNTPSPIPPGYKGVGVLGFKAYQNGKNGLADAVHKGLPSWVQGVQYDSEHWSWTPEKEQGAWLYNKHINFTYAKHFCELAHSKGLKVVLTPGNDLCNNISNPAYPNQDPQYPVEKGESIEHAYVRHGIATAAKWLSPGDVYEYQAQPLELTPSTYKSITTEVANQVRNQKSGITFLAGIGRVGATWDHASADQLFTAANSVSGVVAGFWPNVDANATRVHRIINLLQKLGY